MSLWTSKELWVRQRKELAELIGFETRNKYEITDPSGQVLGFAAEQQKGIGGFFLRQFLGHWRSFEVHVFDSSRNLLFIARHPFRFFFQRMEVTTAAGKSVGAIQYRFALFHKKFDIEDAAGQVRYSSSAPFWKIWTFPIHKLDREVGVIRKKWSGLLKEAFTDEDNFQIGFGANTFTQDERMLVFAAAIYVDLVYFERKAKGSS